MTKLEKLIRGTVLFRFLETKTKKIILPGFQGVPLYDVIGFFRSQLSKTGLTERAAAISYNFIMAIPPMCLFLFSLIPHLPFIKKRVIKMQVGQLIKDIVPAKEHNSNLIEFVNGFLDNSSAGLLSFGLILILFFASNGMMGIMRSFNKDYIGFEKRNGLQKRWNAIRLTILIMLLLLATLILLILQGTVLSWLGIKNKSLLSFIGYIRWGFILGLVFYSIAFIYKYAPSVKKKWDIVSPGALLATSLSILATIGFSVFVNNFGKYNALYGSIGSVIVIMSIVFINSLALLIGYELNVSIHSLQHMAQQRAAAEKKELVAN